MPVDFSLGDEQRRIPPKNGEAREIAFLPPDRVLEDVPPATGPFAFARARLLAVFSFDDPETGTRLVAAAPAKSHGDAG